MTEKNTGAGGTPSREKQSPEPWLRGTHTDMQPVERAVLHSLELAREDIAKWCASLDDRELRERPPGLPSVAFQLRHIARSLNRFMSYGDGRMLSGAQLAALADEQTNNASKEEVFSELRVSLREAEEWLRAGLGQPYDNPIRIGRRALPTNRGGLLVHMAEHTQRHVGQAVTTAKAIIAQRTSGT